MQLWQLNPQARWRRTLKGGAALLPETAATVELDAEAFTAVSLLKTPLTARRLRHQLIAQFNRNFTLAETDILLRDLAAQGFLVESRAEQSASSVPGSASPGSQSHAPESVHLQLNNVCNLRCPSCYLGLHEDDRDLLSLARLCALIDECAEMGVFQLALGGGEALLSPKFAPVARYARQRGLVPNVTTNGWLITEKLLDEVQGSLGELRLSLNDAVTVNKALLEEKAALLRARRMRFGFNLIVTQRNLNRLSELLEWACAQGAATINLIRPKPAPGNDRWYTDNALTRADAARLLAVLKDMEPLFTQTALTVDCAFSFLFHGQSARQLESRGVAGCAMGERFATIKWNGDVYPCSHLHGEEFRAGSVLSESFRDIWERSQVFTKLRRDLPQVNGHCGGCAHNAFCKGCRAAMQQRTGDWLAADTDCPVPVAQAQTKALI
jgi:pyrroloquinoline quinone biosynthesis protein E